MSGARGLRSGCAAGSSTCNLRSAAFSIKAAEILGSLVALANLKRIAASAAPNPRTAADRLEAATTDQAIAACGGVLK
jgi:hypothetical protein